MELEVKISKNIELMNQKVQTLSKAFKLENPLIYLSEVNKIVDDINDRIEKLHQTN